MDPAPWLRARACMRTLLLAALTAGGCGVSTPPQAPNAAAPLRAAESFVDAFYSFDPARLRQALATAPESAPRMLFYQGWAEGGNYVVVERRPCRPEAADIVQCDITVRDDLIAALGTGYNVTDTFHLTFRDGRITAVRVSSNDPPAFQEALEWVGRERPELMEGPCRGFFDGGPTPQDCVRAVVRGFADYAARPRS